MEREKGKGYFIFLCGRGDKSMHPTGVRNLLVSWGGGIVLSPPGEGGVGGWLMWEGRYVGVMK